MPETIRAFIAIPLGPSIQKAVAQVQEELKKLFLDVKWVKPAQIHLTFKFLGDIQINQVDAIQLILEKHLSSFKSFGVMITEAGAFPSTRHPQVLWIGLQDSQEFLKKMAEVLERELELIGFKKESREFQAHITIGRVRSNKNIRALSEKLLQLSVPAEKDTIEKVILLKSTLTSGGPVYEELKSLRLM